MNAVLTLCGQRWEDIPSIPLDVKLLISEWLSAGMIGPAVPSLIQSALGGEAPEEGEHPLKPLPLSVRALLGVWDGGDPSDLDAIERQDRERAADWQAQQQQHELLRQRVDNEH